MSILAGGAGPVSRMVRSLFERATVTGMSKYARFPTGQAAMASHGGSAGDTDPRDPDLGPTEYYGDKHRFPLHAAAWDGDADALRERLNAMKSRSELDGFDCSGNTALDWAAGSVPTSPLSSRTGCVRLLLERGASLGAVASDGWTPLHYAAQWGDWPAVVELLLGAGAELMAKTSHGETACDVALRTGFMKTAGILARAEASTPAAEESVRVPHAHWQYWQRHPNPCPFVCAQRGMARRGRVDEALTPGVEIYVAGRGCVGICGFTSRVVGGNLHTVCVTTRELQSASSPAIRRDFVEMSLGAERWSSGPLDAAVPAVEAGGAAPATAVPGSALACCGGRPTAG